MLLGASCTASCTLTTKAVQDRGLCLCLSCRPRSRLLSSTTFKLMSKLSVSKTLESLALPNKFNMRTRGEENSYCCFHPKQVMVGVCAVCLKERLQVLASKRGQRHPQTGGDERSLRRLRRQYSSINIRKVFALGSNLLQLYHKNKYVDSHDESSSIASLEDSFISIKFEENGQASWHTKKTMNTTPSTSITCGSGIAMVKSSKGNRSSVVEHAKPDGVLRWHKRIGHLLHLAHWNKSNKASSAHAAFGSKVGTRKGWIRNLTRRATASTD